MLDVMGEDYIKTARSKGMPERRVVMVHALRPSLTPVVTQAGLDIGTALGGVILIETVFVISGLGWTAVQAINQQDLPVIVGIVVLAAAFVVLANVLVDIAYPCLTLASGRTDATTAGPPSLLIGARDARRSPVNQGDPGPIELLPSYLGQRRRLRLHLV